MRGDVAASENIVATDAAQAAIDSRESGGVCFDPGARDIIGGARESGGDNAIGGDAAAVGGD